MTQTVTFLNWNGGRTTGLFDGVTHKQTGEMLVSVGNSQLWVKPANVIEITDNDA